MHTQTRIYIHIYMIARAYFYQIYKKASKKHTFETHAYTDTYVHTHMCCYQIYEKASKKHTFETLLLLATARVYDAINNAEEGMALYKKVHTTCIYTNAYMYT